MPRTRKNKRYVLFWIKSNRGTDEKAVFEITDSWDKTDIKSALEKWCSQFGAWSHDDNVIHYGFKPIKIPNKNELAKQYNAACKSKARAVEKWKILAAMLNVKQFSFL